MNDDDDTTTIEESDIPGLIISDKDKVTLAGMHQVPTGLPVAASAGVYAHDHHEGLPTEPSMDRFSIVKPEIRPVIDVVSGDFHTDHPSWVFLNRGSDNQPSDPYTKLLAALPGCGRLDILQNDDMQQIGSGFMVSDRLLATKRHVVEPYVEGVGVSAVRLRSNVQLHFTTGRESLETSTRYLLVDKVVMVHPYWDFALLSLEANPPACSMLVLDVDHKANQSTEIVVIGYPTLDRNNPTPMIVQRQILRNQTGVKRLAPGYMKGQVAIEDNRKIITTMKHDASTTGGASGSPLLDSASGLVVGIHFGNDLTRINYAIAASDLAKDQYVIDAGVNFSDNRRFGDVDVSWKKAWERVEGVLPA